MEGCCEPGRGVIFSPSDPVLGGADSRVVSGVSGKVVGIDDMYVASTVVWRWAKKDRSSGGGLSWDTGVSDNGRLIRRVARACSCSSVWIQ